MVFHVSNFISQFKFIVVFFSVQNALNTVRDFFNFPKRMENGFPSEKFDFPSLFYLCDFPPDNTKCKAKQTESPKCQSFFNFQQQEKREMAELYSTKPELTKATIDFFPLHV